VAPFLFAHSAYNGFSYVLLFSQTGIDLGTTTVLVFVPKTRHCAETSRPVVAISQDDNRILAVGNDAKEMIGRTPDCD